MIFVNNNLYKLGKVDAIVSNIYLKEINYLGKLIEIYNLSQNKINGINGKKFLVDSGIRINQEVFWRTCHLYPQEDDDFGSPCHFVNFLDRQVFYLISNEKNDLREPKYIWKGNYFEGLNNETYLDFQKKCFDAFVDRVIDFYRSHGNTFFPEEWEDPKINGLANLRGPLEKYLIN